MLSSDTEVVEVVLDAGFAVAASAATVSGFSGGRV
jgi:hypothetical protein